ALNILYIRLYQNVHDFFLSWSWKGRNWLEPSMGMLIAAVLMAPLFTTMRSMGVVGGGYTRIIESTDLHIITLTGVILTVIIATAFITGTGGSGGLFMPIMFIGNLMGLLIASLSSFPHPVILAAVGISASLCTTLNIPLASALISIELFGPVAILPSVRCPHRLHIREEIYDISRDQVEQTEMTAGHWLGSIHTYPFTIFFSSFFASA
ncbi:MAG: chloride channel protein, partial [bacterium]|nr:chloride channel protein [bacterium]